MKRVVVIGVGCGTAATLTLQAERTLREAEVLVGAPRLLDMLPGQYPGRRVPALQRTEILNAVTEQSSGTVCILCSGDTGFYSVAESLNRSLTDMGLSPELQPGISSIQALSAALGRPWQNWRLVSAHGRDCDLVYHVSQGSAVCVLAGTGKGGVQSLCADLTKAGLGSLSVTVGEYLTCPQERIVTASAQELAQQSFAPLSLLLVQAAPRAQVSVPGIPDAAFLRGSVPMTKQEIRCIIPSRLALRREDVCWDIGAGTGSVSVELALQCRAVWAVEQKEEAVALIGQNRQRFCAWNLRTVCAKAPSALEQLPDPDAVFIGGSGGHLEGILSAVLSRNPAVRLCISAVTLETLHSAVTLLQAAGISPEISQISAARTRAAGASHLLTAQNPVFLISGAAG